MNGPNGERLLVRTPVSRNNAPDTSHQAEIEINADGTRAKLQHRITRLVRLRPNHTALELYTYFVHPVLPTMQISTLRARLTDMTGITVEKGAKRPCEISKKMAVTWHIKEPKQDERYGEMKHVGEIIKDIGLGGS